MLDPTLILFNSHLEAIIFFMGMFVLVFVLCLRHYISEKDKEIKKDTLVQWVILDGLFALGIAITVFYGVSSGML